MNNQEAIELLKPVANGLRNEFKDFFAGKVEKVINFLESEPPAGEFTKETTLMDLAIQLHNIYEPNCVKCSYTDRDWMAVKEVILPIIDRLKDQLMAKDELIKQKQEVIDSIAGCIVTQPKDFSLDCRDAWMYWILLGWGDAEDEILEKHKWNSVEVKRLKRLREQALKGEQ